MGEIGRAIDTLIDAIRELRQEIAGLPSRFVPRETFELAQGANRVEIDRNSRDIAEIDKTLAQMKQEQSNRTRQYFIVAITALLGPLFVVLVSYALTRTGGG